MAWIELTVAMVGEISLCCVQWLGPPAAADKDLKS